MDFGLPALCQRRFREERLAFGKGNDVGGGHAGDFGESFLREKSLVRRDEHIWKSEQSRDVVVQDLAGKILEEDAFLFVIHVERLTPPIRPDLSVSISGLVSTSAPR